MIGGAQHAAANRVQRLDHPAQAGIHGLGRLDRGGKDAAMPDHVAIGIVDDDQIEAA